VSLLASLALVDHASLFIGNDSGLLHAPQHWGRRISASMGRHRQPTSSLCPRIPAKGGWHCHLHPAGTLATSSAAM
jgi:hypothetical protein